jgi:two-component system, response regulator PdtaR
MILIKILLVEDNPIIAFDLETLLTEWGYEVVGCAITGEEALRMFKEFQPDLAIVDVLLEGDMDGIETVQQFNDIREIPVVYLTAQGDFETVERAKSSSPIAYVLKPFDDRSLQISLELAFDIFTKHKTPSPKTEDTLPATANGIKLNADMILQNENCIFIKHNYRFVKLRKKEILMIEANSNYCFIHTKQHRYLIRMPLTAIMESLQDENLIRIHRSFSVNIKAVDEFSESELIINGKTIPISATFKDVFLKRFNII